MADDKPKQSDTIAVLLFCNLIGAAFLAGGVPLLMNGEWVKGGVACFIGLVFAAIGIRWSYLSSSRFTSTVREQATNFRSWILVALAMLFYLSMPRLVRPLGIEPEVGDPSKNKYVCKHRLPPIKNGQSAMLFEFGVRNSETYGFHTQITLKDPIADWRVWYGSPRRTSPPLIAGAFEMPQEKCEVGCFQGPGGCSICVQDSKVFDLTCQSPDIRPRRSYYVYLATDGLGFVTDKVTFFDDVLSMDDHDRVIQEELIYGPCPSN